MIEGKVVALDYDRKSNWIDLWLRANDGSKIRTRVTDFYPYYYIPDETGFYVGLDGKRLQRIVLNSPEELAKHRNKYDETYEANIEYVQRLLIDTNVYSGIMIPNKPEISWKDIEPSDSNPSLKTLHLDIEVANKGERITDEYIKNANDEIISVALNLNGYYITLAYREDLKQRTEMKEFKGCPWRVIYFSSEGTMLDMLLKTIKKIEPDILYGYNILTFDIPYLKNRYKNTNRDVSTNTELDYRGFDVFDGMIAYTSYFRSDDKFVSLKEVAELEGLIEEGEKEFFSLDWWYDDIEKLIYYNTKDVWYTYEIDKKKGLLSRAMGKKVITGLSSFSRVFEQNPGIDVSCLRIAKQKGIVAPTKPKLVGGKKKGAEVLKAVPNLYKNVAIFDFSRYYPSIMLSFKLDPAIMYSYYTRHETFDLKRYAKFAKEYLDAGGKTILLDVIMKYMQMRDWVDAELAKTEPGSSEYENLTTLKQAVKGENNAIFGVSGYKSSRWFCTDIFNSTTGIGREGIQKLVDESEKLGYTPIYGDTDSIMVQCPLEEAENLSKKLTNTVANYFKEQYGLDTDIKLEFEKYLEGLFLVAKKNYAYKCIFEKKHCNYIGYKGLSGVVRTDSSRFIKSMMQEMFEIILNDRINELEEWLPKKVGEFKKQKLSEIAIASTIKKPRFEDYGTKGLPAHVKGAIYSNTYFGDEIEPGMRVWRLFVKDVVGKPRTTVVAFSKPELFDKHADKLVVDWERMKDVSIRKKIQEIFEILSVPIIMDSQQMKLF